MDISSGKLIEIYLLKPRKASDRPEITRIRCLLKGECPFLKRGECIEKRFLGYGCVYGRTTMEQGPLQRSKGYQNFITQAKEQGAGSPKLNWANRHLAVLDEYVYMPYSHADMCEAVPFLAHSKFMSEGKPFILLKDFTAEVISKLIDFRPQALFCGEITHYQQKSVPVFLFHLKYMMPEIYDEVCKINPKTKEKIFDTSKIDKLAAKLDCIKPGDVKGYVVGSERYTMTPVSWDGEYLEVTGEKKDFPFIFADFEGTDFVLKFKPIAEKTAIIIADKDLIEKTLVEHPELLRLS